MGPPTQSRITFGSLNNVKPNVPQLNELPYESTYRNYSMTADKVEEKM